VLRSLQVRNFAIIDEAEIEFDDGMTVLTGETGAGKSILVDALGLVLGERGGAGLVRTGAERAEFSAQFDLDQLVAVRDWLEEHALDIDNECVLRRVINADGRSRAFINATAVPLQNLKVLGELLLDIHGQHFHQSLSRRDVQRDLLDHYGKLTPQCEATSSAFAAWQSLSREHDELEAANADRASKLELLSFQCNELDALDVQEDELVELRADREILRNSGRLADGIAESLQKLFDAESANVHSALADVCQSIEALTRIDAKLEPTLALLQEAGIQISEATSGLRRYGDSLDMDPQRAELVEERLNAIQTVARKHRIEAEQLHELATSLRSQLESLEHAEERGAELAVSVQRAKTEYIRCADGLTELRTKAAMRLSREVTATMADLGMPGGAFEITLTRVAPDSARSWGLDKIEYRINANPGQSLAPLSKVASGGELSRMALAIQVIASDGSAIPTMVFDEVDSGVGGGVAEMVGRRLRDLGETRQVFCVTHLPQVASLADHHYRVIKITDGKSTRTGLSHLTEDERVEELARMLGGIEITQRTRDHASEMLGAGKKGLKARSTARQGSTQR
jgi:DNA repair protein RecN (Recombination protein N)